MKLLHICFCVLIGTALSGCEIPMTAQDRIAVTRICEVLELKAQVAAAVWPGFDDPQFEVAAGLLHRLALLCRKSRSAVSGAISGNAALQGR